MARASSSPDTIVARAGQLHAPGLGSPLEGEPDRRPALHSLLQGRAAVPVGAAASAGPDDAPAAARRSPRCRLPPAATACSPLADATPNRRLPSAGHRFSFPRTPNQ